MDHLSSQLYQCILPGHSWTSGDCGLLVTQHPIPEANRLVIVTSESNDTGVSGITGDSFEYLCFVKKTPSSSLCLVFVTRVRFTLKQVHIFTLLKLTCKCAVSEQV